MRKLILPLLFLFATAALAQQPGCLWWGYHHADDVPENFLGISKPLVYEAAIHVSGAEAPTQGATISAVRLPFYDVEHIDSLTLWISSDLEQAPQVSIFAGKPQAGWNVISLSPITVPAEGLYVGYTFKVTDLDGMSERPLIMCNEYSEGGLWLRIAGMKQYADWYNTKRYGSLAMQLEMQGPGFSEHAASVDAIRSNNVVANTSDSLQVMFSSYGTEAVSSLQYAYAFGNETFTGSYSLQKPLPRVYGIQAFATLPLQAPQATGRLPLNFQLTGLNGNGNTHAQNTASADVLSLQRKAHHRTVMEEYTGTWCSACPRGFAGIARLKKAYPDDFIAISVHVLNGDPMDVYYDYYYVMNATLFPSCRFDRGDLTDPYDGDFTDGHFHADLNFLAANAILAPADMSVEAQWTEGNLCNIQSTVDFVFDDDECRYSLAYVMIEDSLSGPDDDHKWHQMNSFSDPSMAYYTEDDMQQYVNAEGTMLHGVKYNDVVTAMSDVRGIDGSLSGPQRAGIPMTHSYQLQLPAISQNKANIHIVALLIDKQTKRIANAAICPVVIPEAVQSVAVSQQQREQRYDLQGRPADTQKGLLIVRQADGTVRKQFIH